MFSFFGANEEDTLTRGKACYLHRGAGEAKAMVPRASGDRHLPSGGDSVTRSGDI
jgi:hypothetical protein